MLLTQHWHSCLGTVILFILLQIHISYTAETKCETCKNIAKRFNEGLEKTANSNFGGGNTHWEEKKLGSFASSETRFLEIIEHCCDDGKRDCHHMLEKNEEVLEDWWFLRYAKGFDQDLNVYLCQETLKVCCPDGTYGADCTECLGGKESPCSGNGACQGSGTREGSGKCTCNAGYDGEVCDRCSERYFAESLMENKISCKACHRACNTSCHSEESSSCTDCQTGWNFVEGQGCIDIDECTDGSGTCSFGTYCLNNEGAYDCPNCDPACNGCTGSGPHQCQECSQRYFQDDTLCRACHRSCANFCTDDSFKSCDSCASGWQQTAEEGCQDIDECSEETHDCKKGTYCVNNEGGFACLACPGKCGDCTGTDTADCLECRSGYEKNENGECIDVDECTTSTEACTGVFEQCINNEGSYRCECQDGYIRRKGSQCYKKHIVEKKKKKKEKTPPVNAQPDNPPNLDDFPQLSPDADGFKESDLERLGKPIKGTPIEDDMIVMEGKFPNPQKQTREDKENDETVNPRDDL